MFYLVLTIALANLLAGFAAGYWLTPDGNTAGPETSPTPPSETEGPHAESKPAAAPQTAPQIATDSEIALASFEREHSQYQGRLANLQDQLRSADKTPPEQVGQLSRQLLEMNRQWLAQQSKVSLQLQADQQKLSTLLAKDSRLVQMLEEQSAEVEASCQQIEQLGPKASSQEGALRLAAELSRLVGISQRLQDAMTEPTPGETLQYPAAPSSFATMTPAMMEY